MNKLFVLGAPRTGTTLVGRYIASHPQAFDLGEYFGFYLALSQVPHLMRQVPSPEKEAYLRHLVRCTADFAETVATKAGASFWCDQTPWNLLIAKHLATLFPDGVFVLMLRHYSGAILSLQRSFASGYRWAGSTAAESAQLWASFYNHVSELPAERTVVVSYDRLCAQPDAAIRALTRSLVANLDLNSDAFKRRVFSESHATKEGRHTIGAHATDGSVSLRPVPSIDSGAWTNQMERECREHVSVVDQALRLRFGLGYVRP